jgi:hypothetical protein
MKYRHADYLNHVRGFAERGLTIGQINIVRTWLTAKGFENTLVIVREGERNKVYIRVTLTEPTDFEAAWLFTIHGKRVSREQLMDLFMQRMQVA